MEIMSILLITTLDLLAFISLVATKIISSMATMEHHMTEESENPDNHHDDYVIIYDDAEENGLGDRE